MTSSGAARGGSGAAVAIPGAVPDAVRFFDAAINVGTNQLTSAAIVAGMGGRAVYVHNAGAGGVVPLRSSVVSSVNGTATLADNAAATVAAQTGVIGTDNTAAITAAINNTHDRQRLFVPGPCLVTGALPALAGSVDRGFVGYGGRTNFPQHGTFAAPAGEASRVMPASALIYTGGNIGRFIDARHSAGFLLDGCAVFHIDSAMVGVLVDICDDALLWTTDAVLHDATIGSLRGGSSCIGVSIRHVQGGIFEAVDTFGCDVQYRHTPVGGVENGVTWRECQFRGYGTVPVMLGSIEGGRFIACNFYVGNGDNFVRWCSSTGNANDEFDGLSFHGCWSQDVPGGGVAGFLIEGSIFGDVGLHVAGCRVDTGPDGTHKLYRVNCTNAVRGVVIQGNNLNNPGKIIDFNGKQALCKGIVVMANDWNNGGAAQAFIGVLPANSYMQGTNGTGAAGAGAAPG